MKRIKSGAFSRGFALARVSVAAGAKAASHAVSGIFSTEEEKSESLKKLVYEQVGLLARELGELKGSLMKVGQMLSMYGEHFLPPEANQLLKSLQSQSPPLEWAVIEKQLKRQLGEKLAEIEVDPQPLAAASLGQVHRGRRKSDGRSLAIKVQYPGVDQAIDSDIRSLQSLLSMSRLIPKGPRYDELFHEVKSMLKLEVDYRKELEATDFFRKAFEGDMRYVIPETFPEFSTGRVLTTSWEPGLAVDSPEVLSLSQERRNALGLAALEIYFKELFELQQVQTDPHFGNYRIRPEESGDRLVLFDFGAIRKLSASFLVPYRKMIRAAISRDHSGVIQAAQEMGFLKKDDDEDLTDQFVDLCFLITEPFTGEYDWGASDLPKRVARHGAKILVSFKLRVPPREVVFLDRKMGGIFIFLQMLRVKFDAAELLKRYLS